jgi:hypothetical protein
MPPDGNAAAPTVARHSAAHWNPPFTLGPCRRASAAMAPKEEEVPVFMQGKSKLELKAEKAAAKAARKAQKVRLHNACGSVGRRSGASAPLAVCGAPSQAAARSWKVAAGWLPWRAGDASWLRATARHWRDQHSLLERISCFRGSVQPKTSEGPQRPAGGLNAGCSAARMGPCRRPLTAPWVGCAR